MSLPDDLKFDPASFSGVVRLFPLPNLVLFPHVLQPLHIFEPRYREMLEDALAGDHLIAMAVLAPGWESDYEGRPPVHPVACLGRVATHVALDDGRYNVLVAGLARVALGEELAPTTSFRRAPATVCVERYPAKYLSERESLQRRLFTSFRSALPGTAEAQAPLSQLLGHEVDLGVLTDIVAYTLDLDTVRKAELLAQLDVRKRAKWLLEHLAERGHSSSEDVGFPPDFSAN